MHHRSQVYSVRICGSSIEGPDPTSILFTSKFALNRITILSPAFFVSTYCKSTTGAFRVFNRLVKRNSPEPTDRLFPANHKRQFNRILDAEELKFDRDGNRRTAYSLRHTYICFRLMEGADIYQIAKNCRTSVEMIEKYYASHIKTNLDAAAINVRRSRHTGNTSGSSVGVG